MTEAVRISVVAGGWVFLNKSDTYSDSQLAGLLENIRLLSAFVASGKDPLKPPAPPSRFASFMSGSPDGAMLERSAPASPSTRALEVLVSRLISQAECTLRVRTRNSLFVRRTGSARFSKERLG